MLVVLRLLARDRRARRALRGPHAPAAGDGRPARRQHRADAAEDKDYIRDAWTRVGAATGQPFDFAFLDREGFVYDTEPACRAVVTARRLLPRLALPFMGRISQAFYAENRDMTSADEIAEVAEEAGFDRDAFATPSSRPTPATRPSAIS